MDTMQSGDSVEWAKEAGLTRVGQRPHLGPYLVELWKRRAFATALARFRIEARTSEHRLGLGWTVLSPILFACVYGLVFGIIMPRSSRPPSFIPFLVVGVFTFQYFGKSFSAGAKSITGNNQLVRSLGFPRMLLPIASVLQQLFELVPMVLVMGLIVLVFGEPLSWTWFLLIPVYALMTLFNMGVALVAARLTVHIRDVTQVIPFITRLVFYMSGIFYSLDLVLANRPRFLAIAKLNPVHDYITLVRAQVLSDSTADAMEWRVAAIAGVGMLVIGVLFFWSAESRYGHD